jgi:hypothetical protein
MTPLAGNAQWTVVVTPCENTADLFQVDLTMQLAGQDNPGGENVEAQTQTQTLFVLRPAWADSDDTSNILTNVHDQLQQVRTAQQWP